MSERLSDAEVFGGGQRLSDEEVFGGPRLSDADVFGKGYWEGPSVSPAAPTRFIDILRHPGAALGALKRRFGEVAEDTLKHQTLFGAGTGALADAMTSATLGPDAAQSQIEAEKAGRPRAPGSLTEGIVDFAAGVAGSAPSPESWVNVPIRGLQLAGRPILSRVLNRAASAGAANVATDPVVQAAQMGRGIQEEYSPEQTAMSGVLGAGVGAGIAGAGPAAAAVRDVAASYGRWSQEPTLFNGGDLPGWRPAGAPAPQPKTGPWTVGDLWSALIDQESGGDQGAVSPKGAFGRAQLMPETAEEVAKALGRPGLAKIAAEDSPRGAVANEMLGKIYLDQQLRAFDGDPVLALAAYNAGPGRVRQWIDRFGHPDAVGRSRWLAMVPFKETRDYVHTILGDVAGAPHKLTAEEERFVRGRMDEFPEEDAVDLPPPETPEAPELKAPEDGTPAAVDELIVDPDDVFPGDRPSTGEVVDDPWMADLPDEPPAPSPFVDMTDQALDQMRTGKPMRMGEGPSLVEALVKAGGLRDEAGEITAVLGGQGEDRLLKMLRRVNKGMTLDDAALWAQERGYIGRPDLTERVTPNELIEAIRREVAGERVYPADRVNEYARSLQEHIQDLDEILQHIGMDPRVHSNAEIRKAMDDWMRAADEEELEPGWQGLKGGGEVLGLGGPRAMATGAQAARAAAQRAAMREQIMATTRGGLAGARSPTAMPIGPDGSLPEIKGVPQIVKDLRDGLGFPTRQGRLGLRGALGTYNRKSGVVRAKQMYDLNVLSHEFGHALELTNRYPGVEAVLKRYTRQLKDNDYNPKRRDRREGFAEWFRWYITNPTYAENRIPGFAADFERAMAADAPKELAILQRAQRDYQEFLEAPSLAATREHVLAPPGKSWVSKLMTLGATKGPFGAAKELGDEAYRLTVDFLNPWKRAVENLLDIAEKRTGVRPTLPVVADPYKLLRSMPAVGATGHMDLLHGVHPYQSLDPDSPSFVEALTLALGEGTGPGGLLDWDEGLMRDFGTYLIGRRVLHLYDSVGKPNGLDQPPDMLSREAWAQAVEDLEAAHPQWREAAGMIYDWNNALWQKRRDAGLITEAEYLAGLENHPDYVPLFRDISDKEFEAQPGARGSDTKRAGGVVRLRGSSRAYINPLHSMMQMAYELNAQIARNDALKALDDLGQTVGPDAGRIVERLPPREVRAQEVDVEEAITNVARDFGLSYRDARTVTDAMKTLFEEVVGAEADDLRTRVYRAVEAPERGEPIVYVWRDGERIPLRLPDGKWGRHMVEALAGMQAPMRNLFLDIATIPARALRAGVTAHPAFFLANSFRDQMTAFVLTNVGYRPFFDQLRGLGNEAMQTDLTRIYNVVGGEIGGFQSAAENAARRERELDQLRQRGKRVRHFASWDGFAKFTELSESGTRLGIFDRAMKQAKARGLDDYAAAREASFEARDYMDFDRRGGAPGMRALVRIIPFLNAGVQALDKSRRVAGGIFLANKVIPSLFGGPPASAEQQRAFSHALKLWSVATVLGIGGLALRAAYENDPEYQEVADYLRNTHWVVKLPNGDLAVIPKPYDIALLSNVMERAFEAVVENDPTAWGRMMEGMSEILIPAHDATAIMPFVHIMRNRDAFGSPIVPDYMVTGDTRLEPRDQYTDRTSAPAKAVGDLLNVSPAQLDYLAKSMGGSNARDLLDAMRDRAPIERDVTETYVLKRFIKDWTRGAVSSKQFWDLVSGSDGKWIEKAGSLRSMVNAGKYDEAVKRLHGMNPQERAFVIASVFGEGQEKQDHPMIRAQASVRAIGGMARDLVEGNVRGPDLQPIQITPRERRQALEALSRLTVAEQRNALIMSGVKGWEQKEPLPTTQYLLEFQRAAPELVPALVLRFQNEKVADLTATTQAWAQVRPMLEAKMPPDVLIALMQEKRFPTKKSGEPSAAAMKRAVQDVAPATP